MTYIFDKKDIPSVTVESGQYDFLDAEDAEILFGKNFEGHTIGELSEDMLEKVSPKIGAVFVSFGELEHTIERSIAFMVNDRTDMEGMMITKFFEFSQKIDYFYELLTMYIKQPYNNVSEDRLKTIKSLIEKLRSSGEFRNIVAHAKWSSMTTQGFVRSKVVINNATGLPAIKYYQLTPDVLDDIAASISKLDEELYEELEEIGGVI